MQASLRNSLAVALATTAISTAIGTAAAMGLRRAGRGRAGWDAFLALPILVPEVVLGASLVLLFAAIGLRLGMATVVLAHVGFSISYATVVVRARAASLDPTLEEAAMDLGASPLRAFFAVTLPALAPGILAAALLVFALSIDDYVVTSFVAGVGATTLARPHLLDGEKRGLARDQRRVHAAPALDLAPPLRGVGAGAGGADAHGAGAGRRSASRSWPLPSPSDGPTPAPRIAC